MNPETIFLIANGLALVGWILLVFAPGWEWTSRIVHKGTLPLLLAAAYMVLIAVFFGSAEGGFGSLGEVMKLFTDKWTVLAGWIHYLVFDLFVGSWEVRDSREKGIPHLLLVPCLLFTFMLGPIGFLLYHVLRSVYGRFRPAMG